jgi:hypothetical protein
MSDFKINLDELKKKINEQKSEIDGKNVMLGKPSVQNSGTGNKKFIGQLITSMRHGVVTEATETIKALNKAVDTKQGLPPAIAKNKHIPNREVIVEKVTHVEKNPKNDWEVAGVTTPSHNYNNGNNYGNDGEREGLFEKNLSEQMAQFDQIKMNGNPIAKKIISESKGHNNSNNEVVITNRNMLYEQNSDRNIDKLVEGAFKNVLTEIYTKQKIQDEFIEFLKTEEFIKILSQTINVIAKRNKEKHGK